MTCGASPSFQTRVKNVRTSCHKSQVSLIDQPSPAWPLRSKGAFCEQTLAAAPLPHGISRLWTHRASAGISEFVASVPPSPLVRSVSRWNAIRHCLTNRLQTCCAAALNVTSSLSRLFVIDSVPHNDHTSSKHFDFKVLPSRCTVMLTPSPLRPSGPPPR